MIAGNRRRGVSRTALLVALALAVGAAIAGWIWYHQVCCSLPEVPPVQPVSRPRPTDFAVLVSSSTGTVSPEFYYTYELEIASGGAGRVTVRKGYQDDGPQTSGNFVVSPAALDSLWRIFEANRLHETPAVGTIPSDEIMIGGGSSSARVVASGDTVELEATRRRDDGWSPRVYAFIDLAISQLPDSVRRAVGMR